MQRYKITCLDCGAERKVAIHKTPIGERIDWLDDSTDERIVSARPRLDSTWGFQCVCGNNDLMTAQEKQTIVNPANPRPQEINDIVKNLKQQKPRFEMVGA